MNISPIAKCYLNQIERGLKTIDKVPETLREQVEYLLSLKEEDNKE